MFRNPMKRDFFLTPDEVLQKYGIGVIRIRATLDIYEELRLDHDPQDAVERRKSVANTVNRSHCLNAFRR